MKLPYVHSAHLVPSHERLCLHPPFLSGGSGAWQQPPHLQDWREVDIGREGDLREVLGAPVSKILRGAAGFLRACVLGGPGDLWTAPSHNKYMYT